MAYEASTSNVSFSFKIIDNENLASDADYLVNFTVKNPNAQTITVSFLKPTDWGASGVSIWAWNSGGNLFNAWPGVGMTDKGNNWYSYTFDTAITNVNVIFSKAGSPQTVDIMGVTQNTCYQASGLNGSKVTVTAVDCPTTALNDYYASLHMLVYPQPAVDRFVVELPNLGYQSIFHLKIFDLNGKNVLNKAFNGTFFNIERGNLAAGLYVMKIISDDGAYQFISKLSLK